ncbi:MAG: hypothetical protein UCO54_12940 [Segatella copri]|nr:hypothetical protein [Segatella copri]
MIAFCQFYSHMLAIGWRGIKALAMFCGMEPPGEELTYSLTTSM